MSRSSTSFITKYSKQLFFLGGGILFLSNLLIIPAIANYDLIQPDTQIPLWGLFLLLLFIITNLFIGSGLLILHQLRFFKRSQGLAFVIAVFAICLWGWGFLTEHLYAANRFIATLALLISSWLMVLPCIVGLVMFIYLASQDKAVPLTAVILLALVWPLFFYGRTYGPDQLLKNILQNNQQKELWWYFGLLCPAGWLIPLFPATFLWHTLRLLHQEYLGTQPTNQSSQEPP